MEEIESPEYIDTGVDEFGFTIAEVVENHNATINGQLI